MDFGARLDRLKKVLRDEVVIGTEENVGRLFMRCRDCQRVVPAWNLLKVRPGGITGCPCGSQYVVPRTIPTWLAVWWYFVRGLLIRKWILRRDNYDPRVPWRRPA